jgi:hypothetical protein
VDQRADGRGARHRVRQPDIERDLRALSGASQKQREPDQRRRIREDGLLERADRLENGHRLGQPRRAGLEPLPIERADEVDEQAHGHEQAEVAHAVRDERLLAGFGVLAVLEPEPDEEIAAEPDAFPTHEENGQAVPQDQNQHRKDE